MLKYEIEGGNLPIVICYPEARQTLCTEYGSMRWMCPNMEMQTNTRDGFRKALDRLFNGEGIFHTRITGPGKVYIQSMPVINTAQVLSGYISKGSSDGDSGFTIRLGDK